MENANTHTAAMVAWRHLPLPIAEAANGIAGDAPDRLERQVHLATTILSLGLAIALARCRAAGIVPPNELVESYEHQTIGRLGRSVTQLSAQHPGVLGWNPAARIPAPGSLQTLLKQYGNPTVATALDALRVIRNNWAHGKPLPAERTECEDALGMLLPLLAAQNPDFRKRLLRVGNREQEPGGPELWRAQVMAGGAPEPYMGGRRVALPARVEPGHVILLDEEAGTLVDLHPFVVGDESGLWVFWERDANRKDKRPALRRGAWVVTNGRPGGPKGGQDWGGKGREADVEALRSILHEWCSADVTSFDLVARDTGPPHAADGSVHTAGDPALQSHFAVEPKVEMFGGTGNAEREFQRQAPRSTTPDADFGDPAAAYTAAPDARLRDEAPIAATRGFSRKWRTWFFALTGITLAIALAALWATYRAPPNASDLPSLLTGLPLRWGEPSSDVASELGLPPTSVAACIANVIEIRSLRAHGQPPSGSVTAGGITFHRDAGLYEITIRSDATYADARAAMVASLGVPNTDKAAAAVWNIDDVRVSVSLRNDQVVFRAWRPAIELLYETARNASCPRQ